MALSTTADPTELLQGLLQNVPETSNPFTYLISVVDYALRPEPSSTYRSQLYALSALLALEAILLFASVIIRFSRGTFWLFRLHRPSNVILPHYVNTWTLVTALGLALVQGYVWISIDFMDGQGNDKNYAGFVTLVWIPLYLAFWFACWSLCVSHALHLDASGKKPAFSSAWPLNSFGLGIALAFTASIAATGGLCDKHWREAIDVFRALRNYLAQEQQVWRAGPLTDDQKTQAIILFRSFSWHYKRFVDNFRNTWIVFFVFGAVLEVTFIIVATLHLRSLKKTLREISDQTSKQHSAPTMQEIAVRKTYKALVLVTIAFGIIFTLFGCLFLFITIRAPQVAGLSKEKEAASLMALYLFAVPGFPLSIFLLARSFESPPRATSEPEVTQLELTPSKADAFQHDSFSNQSPTGTTAAVMLPALGSNNGTHSSAYDTKGSYERAHNQSPSVLSYGHDDGASSTMPISTTPSPAPYPSRSAAAHYETRSKR